MTVVLPSNNAVLASLSPNDFQLIQPHLKFVHLEHAEVLAKAGDKLSRVYFPLGGIISIFVNLEAGDTVEVAMLGRKNVFGASLASVDGTSVNDAIVQLPGTAFTLDARRFRMAFNQSASFRDIITRHETVLLMQAQQSSACNARHSAEARLSRWLLRVHDQFDGGRLPVTQEALAQMMGVQRNTVSIVANAFKRTGLIRYKRGVLEIKDADGLMKASCECYMNIKYCYDRLFASDLPPRMETGSAVAPATLSRGTSGAR